MSDSGVPNPPRPGGVNIVADDRPDRLPTTGVMDEIPAEFRGDDFWKMFVHRDRIYLAGQEIAQSVQSSRLNTTCPFLECDLFWEATPGW